MARPQDKQAAMQRVMMDKAYIAKMTHAGSQLVGAPGGVADAGTLAALEKMADETEQYFGSQAPAPEQPGILQQIGGALGSLFGGGGQQQAPPSAAQKAPAQGAPAQSKVVTPVVGKSGKEDKIPPAVLDAARKKRPDLTDAEIIELWKQNSKKTT